MNDDNSWCAMLHHVYADQFRSRPNRFPLLPLPPAARPGCPRPPMHPLITALRPWSFPAATVPVVLTAAIVHRYAHTHIRIITMHGCEGIFDFFNLLVAEMQ